jgi:SpoVK/Ycf46/Vps4 family AAA+-type ATPase
LLGRCLPRIRPGSGGGHSSGGVEQRLLTTFLNELDGVGGGAGSRGVLVLAATNRPLSGLDAALLRPGRLHESLEVNANTP